MFRSRIDSFCCRIWSSNATMRLQWDPEKSNHFNLKRPRGSSQAGKLNIHSSIWKLIAVSTILMCAPVLLFGLEADPFRNLTGPSRDFGSVRSMCSKICVQIYLQFSTSASTLQYKSGNIYANVPDIPSKPQLPLQYQGTTWLSP